MLSLEDVNRILMELLRGKPLSMDSDEARAIRASLEKDVAAIKARGQIVDFAHEHPELPPPEESPAAPQAPAPAPTSFASRVRRAFGSVGRDVLEAFAFREDQHPRDEAGQFTPKDGGGTATATRGKETPAEKNARLLEEFRRMAADRDDPEEDAPEAPPAREEAPKARAAPSAPAPEPADGPKAAAAPAQAPLEAPQPTIEKLDPAQVHADPERFQFKRKTSKDTGAGEQFRDVKRFDPIKAGVMLVWRDKSGKDWIADGHHRLELGKRLGAKEIHAFVLDEAHGVTHQMARATAALRNIAGGKGEALDAAKAIRDMGWTVDDLVAEGISPKSALARDGFGLAALDDSVFTRVLDEEIPQHYAAEIGRQLRDKPAKQRQAAQAIAGAANIGEVESIVRQIKASPEHTETQENLWGEETETKSLFLERAKVETALARRLKADKSLFSTLARKATEAQRVAGNTINREGSSKEAQQAAELRMILETYGNTSGSVKDALDEAAEDYAKNRNLEAAVSRVVDVLRRVDEYTGEARPGEETPGDSGRDPSGLFAAERFRVHPRSRLARFAERLRGGPRA